MRWGMFVFGATVQLVTCIGSVAQTDPPRLTGIMAMPDRTVWLAVAGNAPAIFLPYYDLHPLEASTNAVDWAPLTILLRTNNSANRAAYLDFDAVHHVARFYRTFGSHLPTPFPKPTGPYITGTTSVLLTDPSRTNRYNVATNSSFMVTVWYPALPLPGSLPGPYLESKLAPSLAGLYGVSQTVLAGLRSYARAAAPVDTSAAPYPVVLYSHGFRVGRRDNTDKCEELASHGYVVVAVDHADCLATVFPDGRLLSTTISSFSDALFQSNVEDLRFVLEALTRWNGDDPILRGLLDLQRMGTMGWSYGGGVAAEIGRTDARVKAVVLLDAYLQNAHDVAWLGIQKPFLGIYNATSAFRTPFDQATQDAYWMNISNTIHQHFADWRGWLASPTDAGRRAAVAMNACMISFFDKYLKDQDDHLLDGPTSTYPEVINFGRK
ncbi:MAG TPA: hypothetical protein VNU68_26045 [Verrucomicrobiae bacterium]|nr:hypothetical protein [Verrucomicrobiae bacterium]